MVGMPRNALSAFFFGLRGPWQFARTGRVEREPPPSFCTRTSGQLYRKEHLRICTAHHWMRERDRAHRRGCYFNQEGHVSREASLTFEKLPQILALQTEVNPRRCACPFPRVGRCFPKYSKREVNESNPV